MANRRISVRWLVGLIVIGPVLAVATLLLVLSTATSRRVTDDLGTQIMESTLTRVDHQVGSYMSAAVRVEEQYVRRITQERVPLDDLRKWELPMLDDLQSETRVASICFGSASGATTWLLRHGDRLEVGRVDAGKTDEAREFVFGETGVVEPNPIRTYHYDPRERPWYKLGLSHEKAVWTDVYFWFGTTGSDTESGVGYAQAIRSAQGDPLGVLVIDTTLGALSKYLRELPLSRDLQVFIVDNKGMLVATSTGSVNTPDGKRRTMASLSDTAAREIAESIQDHQTNARLVVDDKVFRMRAAPLSSTPELKWQIIVMMPEEQFMGSVNAALRRNIGLAAIVILACIGLALYLATRMTQPLLEVAEFARKVGRGDFKTKLEINAAQEFVDLSRDLNKMSSDVEDRLQLEHSMKTAMEVQQSLLPEAPPVMPGIDIVGAICYCDSTGGDYYDFVDSAGLGEGRSMIAIGDVMGHGIGAALLMATARAALRTSALVSPPVKPGAMAQLMSTVNRVLSRDARHGKFMSLLIAIIDRPRAEIRWASAGHDLPIIYDIASRQFIELEGNDVLLGLMENIEYEEHVWGGLKPGQIIVLGTDGIWECRNPQKEMFGKDRLREVVRCHCLRSAHDISQQINGTLTTFVGDSKIVDDITYVVIKVTEAE